MLAISFERDVVIAILALVGLITGLVIFLKKRTRVVQEGVPPNPKPLPQKREKAEKKSKAQPKAKEEEGNPIDPSLFSNFRQSLESTEKELKAEPEEEVVVSISPKSRKTSPKSKPYAKQEEKKPSEKEETPEPKKEESIDDLFNDLQEKFDFEEKEQKQAAGEKTSSRRTSKRVTANEFLSPEDFQMTGEDAQQESTKLWQVSQQAFKEEKYQEGAQAINQWFQNFHPKKPGTKHDANLLFMQGRMEYEQGNFPEAAKTWETFFNQYFSRKNEKFLPYLEEVIKLFKEADQYRFIVQFLFTSLNEYRVKDDRAKMDEIYTDIEGAYRYMKDWPRLNQTYQNHLAIKKLLNDVDGQLDILDHLGKLLFDQGDKEGSRAIYQQSIQLKNEKEKK